MILRSNIRKSSRDNDRRVNDMFTKTIIMLLLSFIVFIFAAVAWFAMNKDATATGMSVTVTDAYELEVRGNFIENSDVMTTFDAFTDEFANGIQQEDEHGTLVNIFRTGEDNQKIIWRKNASSTSYPEGLSPSSSGELSFYVIPKKTGVLDLNFNMTIRGYHAVYTGDTLTDVVEITDDLTDSSANAAIGITSAATAKSALKFLNGHILFFKNYDSTTGKYSGFCGTDSISFADFIAGDDKTVIQDQAYPVTVYWKWVNDFGDMFLTSTSPYASAPLFDDLNTDDRALIFDYLEDSDVYMFDGIAPADIAAAVADIQNPSSPTFAISLRTLTTGYDNADLDIGNNVNYMLIEMTSSLGS